MAISIVKPPQMNRDSIFYSSMARKTEDSIQIVLPPKPKGMQGEEDSNTNSPEETSISIKVSSLLPFSSFNQEEDLASSKLPFVWKLYEMLEDVEKNDDSHIVSWVDDGKAFKVHKLKKFVDDIIPRYFRQSKYKSFQRQLYFYGFTRVHNGSNSGAYSHPKFVKGVKTLCLSMTPKKAHRRSSKKKKEINDDDKEEDSEAQNRQPESKPDPSEWMTQIENLITYGADPQQNPHSRRRSSAYESIDMTSLERGGPSDGDIVFVFGGKPFHFVETEFADLPRC